MNFLVNYIDGSQEYSDVHSVSLRPKNLKKSSLVYRASAQNGPFVAFEVIAM